MARPVGGINLSTNFGLQASLPLDARNLVSKVADLASFNKSVIEDGHIVYCKEDSKFYYFDSTTDAFKDLFSVNGIGQVENYSVLPTSGISTGTIIYVKNPYNVGVNDVRPAGFYIYDGNKWTIFDVSENTTTITFTEPTTMEVGGIPLGTSYPDGIKVANLIFDLLHPYVAPDVTMVLGQSKGGNYPEADTARLGTIELTSVGGSVPAFKDAYGDALAHVKFYIDDVLQDLTGESVIVDATRNRCVITFTSGIKLFNLTYENDGTIKQTKFNFKVVITVDNHDIVCEDYYNFTKPFYYSDTKVKMVDAADEPGLDASTGGDNNAYLRPAHIITMSKYTKAPEGDTLAVIGYSTNNSYHVFAYPASFGNCTKILDENGFDITNSYKYRTMSGIDPNVEYLVYQSANKCSLQHFTITFKVEYK